MLEPLQNKINSLGGSKVYVIWGKYYLKPIEPPRDLFKQYPQLEQFSNLIKYKPMDKNEFKSRIKMINTKDDIEKVLAQIFRLESQINLPTIFNFLAKASESSVSKSNKKNFKPIFCALIRNFIQISYQLNSLLDNAIRTQSSDFIDKLQTIPQFFSQFQGKYFDNFIIACIPFLNKFISKIPLIFKDNIKPQLKYSCLYLISSFFSLATAETNLHPDQSSQVVIFLIQALGIILNNNKPSDWDLEFVRGLFLIFSQLSANINSTSRQGIELVVCNTSFVFNSLLQVKQVPAHELYQLVVSCLQCFQFSIELEKIDNDLVIIQVSNMVGLIQWLVKNFSKDQQQALEIAVLRDLKDPIELGPIDISKYFSYMNTIQYQSPKLQIELHQVLGKIESIVKLYKNPVSFLNALVTKAFSINLDQLENLHMYIIFIAELILKFDEHLVEKSFSGSWNHLFKPEIFPIKVGCNYDKTLTECCLLIMLRCIMYDEAKTSTAAIFDNIGAFAKAHGEIVFSYFMSLFNSLLVTADENSSFVQTLSKSTSLIGLLISIAQKRLAFFDFIRNLAAKCPNYAFISNEIDYLICQSFPEPKRSKSSIELIGIGLKLAKNYPEPCLTFIRMVGTTISKMLVSKMPKSLELFQLVAKSGAITLLSDQCISKLGPVFDSFSSIAVVFPKEANNILSFFIDISKKSPAVVRTLQLPDSKVYSNLSRSFESNPNEDTVNLLFSFATNDTQNIVNTRALELVLERAKTSKKEFQIILKMNEMCEKSQENLDKICTSEIPGFIISRLTTIRDQPTKNLLFSLYKKICMVNFTVSNFYSAIVIINKPIFEAPHLIIEIYRNLIKSQKSSISPGTILSVFTTPNVGPNILPLFRRLNGCEKCQSDKGTMYCQNCGALKLQDGVKYVSCILYFLAKMLKVSDNFNKTFLNLRGPQLLVQFLSQIKSIYLNQEIIDRLFKIFKRISDPILAADYVESIWMNFDFISQFSEADHNYFFSKIPDAYELNKQAFYKRTIVESVLFKLMNEKSDSNSYALLSSLLNSLVSGANSKSLLSTFFSILYDNSSPALTDSILNMTYMLIVTNNKTMLDILEEFSYFKPFAPLMAIPNSKVQKLALQCIMKMPTAKTNPLKLYSAMIQCSVAYNKSDNDEVVFKLLNENLDTTPSLLPFWSTVCRNFKDPKRIEDTFNQLRRKDPQFHKFFDVPIWFYWIFTLKKFDQESIRQMIFNEKNELNVNHVWLLFDFFEIYQNENDTDFTSIRTSILKTLLTKSFTNCEASKQNLRIIFSYLFFIKFKKQNAKKFNCFENFLNKKLPLFSQKAKYPSYFHLKIDDKTGKWIDATFANEVLTKVTPESSFYVEFSPTYRVHSYILFAYIAHILNKFTRKTNLEISALFAPLLEKADFVTAYTVASILVNDWKLPILNEYLDYYHDEKDSPEYQLFKLEDGVCKRASVNTFSQALNEIIEKAIVYSIPLKEPDNDTSIKAFCQYSDPAIYKFLLDNFSEFKHKQSQKIMQDKIIRSKLLTTFMTKLQLGCGPWALKTGQMRFMILNSTSRAGTRNLMKLYNFSIPTTQLTSKGVKTTLFPVKMIDIVGIIDGQISIVKNSILFEGKDTAMTKVEVTSFCIAFIFKRQFPSYLSAIEIFTLDNRSYVFAFSDMNSLDSFFKQLDKIISIEQKQEKYLKSKFNIFKSISMVNPIFYQRITTTEIYLKMNLLKQWQNKNISNFQYVYYLNLLLGRSYHVSNQYPIFPAIIGNSETINFTNPKFFEPFPNYTEVNPDEILSYLCRIIPFNVPFGKLRVKKPLKDISEIKTGFQELYYLPAFLLNENQFTTIENVKLPQWANNNPYKYVSVLRRALETDYVSRHLPKWLDSAFGNCFLFATPHQQRIGRPNPFQNIEGIPSEYAIPMSSITRIKKQICLCNNNIGIDFRSNKLQKGYVQFKIPSDVHGSVLAVSRMQSCVVYGTKHEPAITLLSLNPNSTDASYQKFVLENKPQSSSVTLVPCSPASKNTSSALQPISCAAVLGDRYLVIAYGCNMSVYKIQDATISIKEAINREQMIQRTQSVLMRSAPVLSNSQNLSQNNLLNPPSFPLSLIELSTTSFHNSNIICIAGNSELGLIVSIDKEYNLLIETLLNEMFIRNTPLLQNNTKQQYTPFVEIFKSGVILVVLAETSESKIFVYDTRGKLIGSQIFQGKIVETDKLCINFAFEYLAVGIENVGIKILDVIDLREDKRIDIPDFTGNFSTISKTRAIVADNRGKLVLYKF